MKVRNDFVTNSSSSSFLLSFTADDEETIKKELIDGFPGEFMEYFPTVFDDVMHEDRMSKEETIAYMHEHLPWQIGYRVYDEQFDNALEKFSSDVSYWDWKDSEEGKKAISDRVEEIIKDCESALDNPVLVMVEYDDCCNGELEHKIMPNLPCTVLKYSWH